MNNLKQYQQVDKQCADCGITITTEMGHIMSMKKDGERVFRCQLCGLNYIKTVGGKREN